MRFFPKFKINLGFFNEKRANDVLEILGRTNENGNRSKIVISAESKEEADKLFNGLSVGGQIEMPISDSPWGSYFGMLRDKIRDWTLTQIIKGKFNRSLSGVRFSNLTQAISQNRISRKYPAQKFFHSKTSVKLMLSSGKTSGEMTSS